MKKNHNKYPLHEDEPVVTYLESLGFFEDYTLRHSRRLNLYHGIRFDVMDRLESIFKDRAIKCSKNVDLTFVSYTGEEKQLFFYSDDDENCNMGEYVSVMPQVDDLEFDVFVRENIFFGIKPTVKAFKTHFLPYEEYIELRHRQPKTKNLYSYARNEFLVKDEISFDDVEFIGIDRLYYRGNYDETVQKVKKLMEVYQINIPFIDTRWNQELYRYQGEKSKEEKGVQKVKK